MTGKRFLVSAESKTFLDANEKLPVFVDSMSKKKAERI